MAVMASAAVSAGLACARPCERFAVASNVTFVFSRVEASYPARTVLSRRPRSHWSVLGGRVGHVGGAVQTAHRHPFQAMSPAGAKACGCPTICSFGSSRQQRVDRRGAPAIFRRLRDVRLPADVVISPCGGIGRRARLKIEFRKECWFDSGQGHQLGCSGPFQSVRKRPRSARKPLKNRPFRVHRCSSPFVLIRSQPSDLLVFLLVSGEQTFTATFAIPNEGN
jgi:hypothetical protein